MGWLSQLDYPVAIIGSVVALVLAWIITVAGHKYISSRHYDAREHYRRRRLLNTVVTALTVVCIGVL